MKIEKVILISLAALLAGCGQESKAPSAPAVNAKPPGAVSGTPAPADPGAPPPPPPPPVAMTAATPAPPGGAPAEAAPGVPVASPGSDPLFYFRRDEKGQVLNDLEALQLAAEAYSRKAGMSESPDQPVWANLTDLSQLVKVGMLKALPAAPAGKKYVVQPKTHKVSLVDQ